MTQTEKMSLKELYLREKEKPTPAQVFINDIATLTKRSVHTVRMWLQPGHQEPDALAKSLIAEKFGIDVEILFPERDRQDPDNSNPVSHG